MKLADGAGGAGVAEASGCEGALCPAVVDGGKVPVDRVGGGVAVELVADVDEVLDRGHVDVVYRGEVQDDGLERRAALVCLVDLAAAGAGVVPWAVAGSGVAVEVCASRFLKYHLR